MILEGPFGILPIEIKPGSMVKARLTQTMKNFVCNNNLPLGIVINNSDDAQLVADRIVQVPATCI